MKVSVKRVHRVTFKSKHRPFVKAVDQIVVSSIDDQRALATLQLCAFCEKNYHTALATETSIKISLLKRFSIL